MSFQNSEVLPCWVTRTPCRRVCWSAIRSRLRHKLLYEVSRELTSILDREELLRRVAESVRKIVDYDVFSVMLWNEKAQLLESVFAMRCNDSIAARLRLPLHHGLTGTAAGERSILRINDVTEDPRYIR